MTVTIFLVSLMGAMAIGMPVAFSLIVCGIALMAYLGIYDSQIVAQKILDGADSFVLLAIPFFMLAGELMNAGGLSRRIVNFALALVGHKHGGLGYVAIVAAIIMASLSGSAAADTAALAAILIPMMRAGGVRHPALGGADRRRRHHRAGDPAVDRLRRLRRRRQRVDPAAVPRRHRPRRADGRCRSSSPGGGCRAGQMSPRCPARAGTIGCARCATASSRW